MTLVLSNVNKLTFFLVSFVKDFVFFVVKYLTTKATKFTTGNRGLKTLSGLSLRSALFRVLRGEKHCAAGLRSCVKQPVHFL